MGGSRRERERVGEAGTYLTLCCAVLCYAVCINAILCNAPLLLLSPGGPGCPGVLVTKKRLLPPASTAPSGSSIGGGTVFFVTQDSHRYLSNREEREEGGTPGIVADIRMGLVMHLKQSIGERLFLCARMPLPLQHVITVWIMPNRCCCCCCCGCFAMATCCLSICDFWLSSYQARRGSNSRRLTLPVVCMLGLRAILPSTCLATLTQPYEQEQEQE